MTQHHLAQLNIAQMKYDTEASEMADFMNNLDRINGLADNAAGFVWRLQTEEGNATGIDAFGPDMLINMSVWQDVASLHTYTYKTAHAQIMSRRKEWFERMEAAFMVLWWVPAGHTPTLEEAKERLALLDAHGPTAEAFTFKQPFPPPSA